LTWSCPERSWRVAFPLIVVASAESVLGLVQFFTTPVGFAHGTYIHRNHFAALLEMVLPFAVAWPVTRMTRRRSGTDTTKTLRKACLGFTAAALILAAIVYSLSRSGISVALGSLVLMALVVVASRGRGRAALAIAVVGTVLCLTGLLAPERLVDRFQGSFDSSGRLSDVRVRIWMDTARLIADNPVFGSGLGGFEPALYRYRTAALDSRVDYAHNDYLQALAELGFIGLGIAGVFLAALAAESIRAIRRSGQMPLALPATAALAAIAAHSLTDFNLHIPANALVAAWVAGIVSGLAATATESENRRNPCI
jgi:O-antigen ligase